MRWLGFFGALLHVGDPQLSRLHLWSHDHTLRMPPPHGMIPYNIISPICHNYTTWIDVS